MLNTASMAKALQFISVLLALLEIMLVTHLFSYASISAGVPDEAMFIDVAKFDGFSGFGTGYGPSFWFLLRSILKVGAGWGVLAAYVFFILLKWSGFLILARAISAKLSKKLSILFLLIVFTLPGYYFFGKIISPEYEILFFTCLVAALLLYDSWRIGPFFYGAFLLSLVAVVTKISVLPLALAVWVYGFLLVLRNLKGLKKGKQLCQFWGLTLGMVLGVGTLVVLICGFQNIVNDIKGILGIVPPSEVSFDRLALAWSRNELTWDRIQIGGLGVDFFPGFLCAVVGLVLIVIGFLKGRRNLLSLILWIAATLMLWSVIWNGIAFAWYLFVLVLLYVMSAIITLKEFKKFFTWLFMVIVCVSFIFQGAGRIVERINFKIDKNMTIEKNAKTLSEISWYVNGNYPQTKTGNVDILIPVEPEDKNVLPARLALQNSIENKWEVPDFLVVEKGIKASPLLDFVVRDQINQFSMVKRFDNLELWINKRYLLN